jgi:four helix bundle protein
MSDYRKLEVWQHAHKLALSVHRTAQGIRCAQYVSLRSQLIREAMSVPANIVEGREQKSERDFARFLRYSVSSATELEYHLQVGFDLHLITERDFEPLMKEIERVRKMLHGLMGRLND